jgi:predicted NAD/FAD-binding protein
VTVLERDERIGGKCCTFLYEGRTYELGAGAITAAYRDVQAFMRETAVTSKSGFGGLLMDLESKRSSFVPDAFRDSPLLGLGAESARLVSALVRERRVFAPGFTDISDELHLPFAEWARRNRLERVAAMVEPWCTGFGYGYFDDVPAAYILKYLALFRFPVGELLDTGYQGLWERVAASLDVRLNVRIDRIARGRQVEVHAGDDRWTFDAVILACPLDEAARLLDVADEERVLFSRIVHQDYDVVAASVDGAPRVRYGFLPRHLRRDQAGHAAFWYRRWLDRDLVLYYALPREGTDLAETAELVRGDVDRMGGRIRNVHRLHRWRYFPHVRTPDMNAGFYQRLESLQGVRNTYFVGELLAFSTVQTVVAYALDLVNRMAA